MRILSVFRSFKIFTSEKLNKEYFTVEDEVSAHSWSKASKWFLQHGAGANSTDLVVHNETHKKFDSDR